MEKRVEIIEPSKEIFDFAEKMIRKISGCISGSKPRLIGSFAIPMCGKKEIDIVIETTDVKKTLEILEKNGFGKGNMVEGEGFCRLKEKGIVCEVHCLVYGDKKIDAVYDKVITILKENRELRNKYSALKISLNGKTEKEYKQAKSKFLKQNIFVQ